MFENRPHFAIIGAGAMGGALGTLLAGAGETITMIDTVEQPVRRRFYLRQTQLYSFAVLV